MGNCRHGDVVHTTLRVKRGGGESPVGKIDRLRIQTTRGTVREAAFPKLCMRYRVLVVVPCEESIEQVGIYGRLNSEVGL